MARTGKLKKFEVREYHWLSLFFFFFFCCCKNRGQLHAIDHLEQKKESWNCAKAQVCVNKSRVGLAPTAKSRALRAVTKRGRGDTVWKNLSRAQKYLSQAQKFWFDTLCCGWLDTTAAGHFFDSTWSKNFTVSRTLPHQHWNKSWLQQIQNQ